MGEAILGGVPAGNVVLLHLDPPSQGTYPDFTATERLFGVRPVCATRVERRGRELWYERDGRPTRILRIYNRLIADELLEKRVELPFRFTDGLDVDWAGHPNWFFRWSKHALPGLEHPLVPESHLVSELARVPEDLECWVLKPLFSFSGSGVKVDVTRADLDAVAEAEQRASTGPIFDADDFRRRYPDGRMGSNPGRASVEAGKRIYETGLPGLADDFKSFAAAGNDSDGD